MAEWYRQQPSLVPVFDMNDNKYFGLTPTQFNLAFFAIIAALAVGGVFAAGGPSRVVSEAKHAAGLDKPQAEYVVGPQTEATPTPAAPAVVATPTPATPKATQASAPTTTQAPAPTTGTPSCPLLPNSGDSEQRFTPAGVETTLFWWKAAVTEQGTAVCIRQPLCGGQAGCWTVLYDCHPSAPNRLLS